jgi:HK97 family phage prohead protease
MSLSHRFHAPSTTDQQAGLLTELRARTDLRRFLAEPPLVDAQARTVDLSFSSTTEVRRPGWGVEILSHASGAMRTERLNASAPLLWNHNWDDQRGVVVPGSVRLDGDKARAKVMFSRGSAGQELFQDVQDGIVANVSVGYRIHDAQLIEVRDDGTDVWFVTDWEPVEISLVSVPADPAVGVGRSAEAIQLPGALPAARSSSNNNPSHQSMKYLQQLRTLFDYSKSGGGSIPFYNADGSVRAVQLMTPGGADAFSLRELQTAALAATTGGLTIHEHKAARMIPVSVAVAERSRVAQAGARILVVDPAATARPVGEGTGVLAFQYTKQQFITVDAAPFALTSEGTPEVPALPEVPEAASPVSRLEVRLGASGTFAGPSYAVRFKLTRQQMRDVPEDQLLQELVSSIALGLARAADHALLSAIVASTPAPFSLAAATAADLQFGQLRAIVGTGGHAAAVGQDGTLRAAGIQAELTSQIAPTVVGSFGSAGVAVHDSLRIHVLRVGGTDLVITCFADFQAMIPDPKFFWLAAA